MFVRMMRCRPLLRSGLTLPELLVAVMLCGGLGALLLTHFLSLPNVVCVGGSWLTPKAAVAAQNWDEVTRLARAASQLAAPAH